ncbi:MAG: hypothetical protein A2X09_14810 [Bacteroidetes bacterium GWF2_43_11]|nr:MAG: hypothetical protein A2X09_14810 [Bacteroidetes bacterium GWF2_43_11]
MEMNSQILKIGLVGDLFPGELPFTVNYGIKSQYNTHRGFPWVKNVKEILGEPQIILANLESPLLPAEHVIKNTFYGMPDFALFLKASGINVLNIANNHILEHGSNGFNSTVHILESAGLGVVGYVENGRSKVLYRKICGKLIAIAGFSNVDLHVITNNNHFPELSEESVLKTLTEMTEKNADVKILTFHWGNEYIHIPQLEQRRIAKKFIDYGADIITGHHPHVIQPYESYKNGHIFYSLGNFMFDYSHSQMVSKGLVAHLEFGGKNEVKVVLSGVKLSYKGTMSSFSPISFDQYYGKILYLYNKFLKLSDDDYNKKYYSLLKRNRFIQRILMKTSIINEFFRISFTDKFKLLNNISYYYKNRVS